MKKLFFIGLATLAVGSATLTACSKYEEGPSLPLTSKTDYTNDFNGTWMFSADKTQLITTVDG
jgi:hypothetical protein